MSQFNLPLSRKPEILRLHQLQSQQRTRYISEFSSCLQEYTPQRMWSILPFLADLYYSTTTIYLCRRRLGEEYTYVAMYNRNHYKYQGTLMNKNTRALMVVLQLLQRWTLKQATKKLWATLSKVWARTRKWRIDEGTIDGLFEEGRMFMLMMFLMGWNRGYNLVDTVLGTQYVYTYFNKKTQDVNYRIQGIMLLTVFVIKLAKSAYKMVIQAPSATQPRQQQSPIDQQQPHHNNNNNHQQQQEQLCRICYDNIKDKSVTCCGHIFCWYCIHRYVATNPECPVCRAACEPREIVQLQNF